YCKMRFTNEANFLSPCYGAGGGIVPAAAVRAEISGEFGRHGALRADGDELAAAWDVCDGSGRRAAAGRFADAGISGVSGGGVLADGEDWSGGAFLGDAGADCGGFAGMRGDRVAGGCDGAGAGILASSGTSGEVGVVARGSVSSHGELHGGAADG